jgi:hypothetical protein
MLATLFFDALDEESTIAAAAAAGKFFLLNYFMTESVLSRDAAEHFTTVGLMVLRLPGLDKRYRRVGLYDAKGKTDWFRRSELETVRIY